MSKAITPVLGIVLASVVTSTSPAQTAYQARLIRETADSVTSFEAGGMARVVVFTAAAYYELALVGVTGVDSITIQVLGGREDTGSVTLYDGPRDDVRNLLVTAGMFRDVDVRGVSWEQFTAAICVGETWVHVFTREHPDGDLMGRLIPVPRADVLAGTTLTSSS